MPVEALVAAGPPELSRLVVSYAPSGTMFARADPAPSRRPPALARLLALGDPAYREPEPEDDAAEAPRPRHRHPRRPAQRPGRPGRHRSAGDVLLEYDGKVLKSAADLSVVPAEAGPKRIPVKLWRNGEVRALEVAAGKLGINPSREETAAEVVLAQRAADEVLKPLTRGGIGTGCPARAARSRRSPACSPRAGPPRCSGDRRPSRPCSGWPTRAS